MSDQNTVNKLYLRIAPDKFHYLKFILEGYDNLAILSSWDMRQGVVMIRFSKDVEHDVITLLSSIAQKIH